MNTIQAAHRTENITYAVRDIVVLAEAVQRQGKEMLYLNIGDPNKFGFQTPTHIVEAIARAMKANHNGYAPSSGIQEARDAIAREAERNGISNIHDIFVTTGASEAIEICLTALVNAGENVLIPSPGYPLYDAVMHKIGAVVNPYYLNEEDNWQPDPADMAEHVNDQTRAVVLINPNNPTGSVYNEKTLRAVVDLAKKHELVIFADEIYDKLILDEEQQHISIASLDHEVPVITFNGLAKSYLGPGLRIGWGIVSGEQAALKDYIEAINKILRARLCAHHPGQYAIQPALEGDKTYLEEVKSKLRTRRDLTVSMLNAAPGISCVQPQGAFYAFPRLEIDRPDEDFVKDLLTATGVVVVHGSGFGQQPGSRHFRVVFLPPEETLKKAYEHIINFVGKYV